MNSYQENICFYIITFCYLFSSLIIIVEKKESLLAMGEIPQKIEVSNQTVTSQVKEKEEITITQTEGRCYFIDITLDILTFDCM